MIKNPGPMNHVNLIGRINSTPKVTELDNGKRIVRFTLTTSETILDEDGNQKIVKHWHRLTAWGKWVQVLESMYTRGSGVAIEGKLNSRYYFNPKGERQFISVVEVNDLVFLA